MPDHVAAYLTRLDLKGYSKHTLRAYAGDLRQAAAKLGELELVDQDLLEAYAAGLARRLKPTSVRRKHAAIRGYFEHLVRTRVRPDNPAVGFEAPKLEERLPCHLSAAQVEQLLGVLRHDTPTERREAAIVACLYFTGMRAGELVGLNVEDLDFGARQLRVFGKGRRERTLPLGSQLGAALYAWLDVHPGSFRCTQRDDRTPLFIRLDGDRGRLSYDAAAAVVKGALSRAGLGRFSCHKLRHTFATRLINRKVAIDKIRVLLGHRRIDTTTIYARTELGADMVHELDQALAPDNVGRSP